MVNDQCEAGFIRTFQLWRFCCSWNDHVQTDNGQIGSVREVVVGVGAGGAGGVGGVGAALRGQVFMVYHSMHCPKGKEAT